MLINEEGGEGEGEWKTKKEEIKMVEGKNSNYNIIS